MRIVIVLVGEHVPKHVLRSQFVSVMRVFRLTAIMDAVTKKFRECAKVPSIECGWLKTDRSATVRFTQTNFDAERRTRFSIDYDFDWSTRTIHARSFPIDCFTENYVKQSPTGKYTAVIRTLTIKKEPRQFLEIWTANELFSSVDLKALDVHGNVYLKDCVFGSLQWSNDEQKLAYVAEQKKIVCEPFYKRKGLTAAVAANEPVPSKGDEYLFEQTWGEQADDKRKSVIVVYNVANESCEIVHNFDNNLFAGQIVWGPQDSCLVGVAFRTHPRKLGIVYCTNRPTELFKIDFHGNYVKLTNRNECFRSPVFTPDFKYLLWLERPLDGPHLSCMKLMKMVFDANAVGAAASAHEEVIGIVDHKRRTANGHDFFGLYDCQLQQQRIWLSDNRKLVFSTVQEYTVRSYVVDIETNELHELTFSDANESCRSHSVLDCWNDTILVKSQELFTYDSFLIGKIDLKTCQVTEWIALDAKPRCVRGLENYTYDVLRMEAVENDAVRHFNAIYLHPKQATAKSLALIVMPHGGPHSLYTNVSRIHHNLLASLNFGMLLINYRGSIGSGQQSIEFLTKNVNRSDISDCMTSIEHCLDRDPAIDRNAIHLWGGSYGGFLVAHLSGQFPDRFRTVVAINPVIDLASMYLTSDIPDWCFAESDQNYFANKSVDDHLLLKMRHLSPIENIDRIVAPTLLLLGTKDLRVPHYQGLHYYYTLKERGIKTKALLYEDNHNLMAVNNEMDSVINGVLWVLGNGHEAENH